MEWKFINKVLPEYYKYILVELNNREIVKVWRANNGDYNIWTKFDSNQVFYDEDIVKWKNIK